MPSVRENETKSKYLSRCIPMLIKEGKSQDQAVAQCLSMFRQKWKAKGVDFKDDDEMMEKYMQEDDCPECDEIEAFANHQKGIFELDIPNKKFF